MNAPCTRLDLRVVPNASRAEVVGWLGEALKVKVMAPPEGGRANEAVVALLAAVLDIAPRAVVIESGATARTKRVRLDGLDAETVRSRLRPGTNGSTRR